MSGGATLTPLPNIDEEENAYSAALRKKSMLVDGNNSQHIEQLHSDQEKEEKNALSGLSDYYDEKVNELRNTETVKNIREKVKPIREGLHKAGEMAGALGSATKKLYIDAPVEMYKELTKDRSKK